MDNNIDIMMKRISELAVDLGEEKMKNYFLERKYKQVVEENDRLVTEILNLKVGKL